MFPVSAGKPAHSSSDTEARNHTKGACSNFSVQKNPTFHEIFLVASFRRTKKHTTGFSNNILFNVISLQHWWGKKSIPGGTTVCVEYARSPMSTWVSSGDSGLLPNPKDVTWGECPMYMNSAPIFVRMSGAKTEGHLRGWRGHPHVASWAAGRGSSRPWPWTKTSRLENCYLTYFQY